MTLLENLQRSLVRAGLSDSTSTFQDKARDYFNMGMKEIAAKKQWRWLFKDANITTTASTATYDLANDVMRPLAFRNVTDDFEMKMVTTTQIDRVDPDADMESGGEKVAITGWNSTNDNWSARIWPTPDTSAETISYRYYAFIEDFTSSDDATQLGALGIPDWAQTSMVYYVASQVMSEKGDFEGAMMDKNIFDEQVAHYANIDRELDGVQSNVTQLSRSDSAGFGEFQFKVNDGSLA